MHVLDVPEHAPDQPRNVENLLVLAVSLTEVPWMNVDPDGVLVTDPLPVPVLLTVNV